MKYIYKHGNQYWYQRAVPLKLIKILGKKTLKIPLKTNKISTAVKRSTLQALEHKKMFNELAKQSKMYLKKFFGNKFFDTGKYIISFNEDYEDIVKNLLFNKHELLNLIDNAASNKLKKQTLKNILIDDNSTKLIHLSQVVDEYIKLKNIINDSKKIYSIKRSISIMIDICGDKPLVEYSKIDAEKFKEYFINLKKISTGKRNQSNIQNLFEIIFDRFLIDKRNPFSGLKWPIYKKTFRREILTSDEFDKIRNFCLEKNDLTSAIFGLIIDTGCSFSEIVGLKTEDINLDKYNPYIVIRSNSLRQIKNLYKKRIIPLVGTSFKVAKKIKKSDIKDPLFLKYHEDGFKNLLTLEQKINSKFKELINGKTSISLRYTLIERLKKIGCPGKIIYEVIGKANKDTLYKNNISLAIKHSWMSQIIN